MSSKGKQISVIVAGATGSLGQEIVSRLVSHPDVSRVVALARHPIPVNRWTSVFPHLHIGDARRYLSVVPVDWEKILVDASYIPRSYVSDGVWRLDDAEAEWKRYERHRRRAARSARSSRDSDVAHHARASLHGGRGSGPDAGSSGSGLWLSTPPQGYIKMPSGWSGGHGVLGGTRGRGGGPHSLLEELHEQEMNTIDLSSTVDSTAARPAAKGGSAHAGDTARRRWSQEFLRQFLQNSFYRSVFSGHQVAINCIGTSHVLSSAELTLVDYDLSMAFAKIVRLFNCMAHAEPTEDEERLLVEATSRELDSVLWNEIYAACYGKPSAQDGHSGAAGDAAAKDSGHDEGPLSRLRHGHRERRGRLAEDTEDSYAMADATRRGKGKVHQMNRGQVATLRHFSQVSVRAANERSPLAYLRTSGKRDRDLLILFNRWKDPLRAASQRLRHLAQSSRASVQFGRPALLTSTGSSSPPPPRWLGARSLLRRVLFGGFASPISSRGTTLDRSAAGHANPHHAPHDSKASAQGAGGAGENRTPSAEEVARKRAQMLLRRDVVKIWEQANLSIWRPGVFRRPGRRRMIERVFALMERPVDVRCLAECIVDDIVDSFYTEQPEREHRDGPRVGKTKIINGSSVARRTHMKALEDGLNRRDTQRLPRRGG